MRKKILVHHPSESDGTSFYRAYGPMILLQKMFPDQIELIDGNDTNINWVKIIQADIVFMQRPATKWQMDFIKMAIDYGVPVWIDWDDHYLDIPDTNNRKEHYNESIVETIRWMIRNADHVTVSTQYLLEEFSKLRSKSISMIRNATDLTFLFDTQTSKQYKREKLILWRGSDTHNADFDCYKKEILELMDETPEYTWGFFGYCPQWAIDHLPSTRIKIWANDGVIEYINKLIKLAPEIVYVPLENIPFNHAKSNIAWQEGTLAGAKIVMPYWEEWKDLPGYHYEDNEGFKAAFRLALEGKDKNIVRYAKNHLCENFDLGKVNAQRIDIALTIKPIKEERNIDSVQPFTDLEFFRYNKEHGWTQDNPLWNKGMDQTVAYCVDILKAKSAVDIGCGSGALLEAFLRKGIAAYGIDSNTVNKEYFDNRNPEESHRFILDYAQNAVIDQKVDVVTCIEVFEHIPDEFNEQILTLWKERCDYFLFSSTPYTDTPEFDKQWGHINVKPTDHWIKFFEKNGFLLIQKLDYPAPWALLFKSCYRP